MKNKLHQASGGGFSYGDSQGYGQGWGYSPLGASSDGPANYDGIGADIGFGYGKGAGSSPGNGSGSRDGKGVGEGVQWGSGCSVPLPEKVQEAAPSEVTALKKVKDETQTTHRFGSWPRLRKRKRHRAMVQGKYRPPITLQWYTPRTNPYVWKLQLPRIQPTTSTTRKS